MILRRSGGSKRASLRLEEFKLTFFGILGEHIKDPTMHRYSNPVALPDTLHRLVLNLTEVKLLAGFEGVGPNLGVSRIHPSTLYCAGGGSGPVFQFLGFGCGGFNFGNRRVLPRQLLRTGINGKARQQAEN